MRIPTQNFSVRQAVFEILRLGPDGLFEKRVGVGPPFRHPAQETAELKESNNIVRLKLQEMGKNRNRFPP
ncbi:MAG: hypothetical protein ACE1Z1_00565, partial [Candidatus Acidiferrales bacterium]